MERLNHRSSFATRTNRSRAMPYMLIAEADSCSIWLHGAKDKPTQAARVLRG